MIKTSPQTTSTNATSSGFTLLELLIVVALITLFSVVALPGIGSYFRVSLNSATREMATTIKEAYNSTVITGRIHRVAYDLKEAKYWVESGPTTILLDTVETKEKADRKKRYQKADTAPSSPFTLDRTITRSKVSLPTGVTFEDILTQTEEKPVKEGMVYTHFFPQGFTEQTLIHLQDESNHHISLAISPLVGRTDLFDRYVERADAFGK